MGFGHKCRAVVITGIRIKNISLHIRLGEESFIHEMQFICLILATIFHFITLQPSLRTLFNALGSEEILLEDTGCPCFFFLPLKWGKEKWDCYSNFRFWCLGFSALPCLWYTLFYLPAKQMLSLTFIIGFI